MITISTRLGAILTTLRQAIAAFAVQQNRAQTVVWLGTIAYTPISHPNAPARLPDETWALLSNRLARIAAKFTALFARWRTNTLPTPRPSRAGRPYTPKPIPRLPATRGWVNHRVAEAAPCAGMLDILLQEPDLPRFLAEAPQAGRLLRPLCHALGLPEPSWLKLPQRPKRIFSPPARGRGEPEGGSSPTPKPQGTPFRPLQPYIRAAARAWKKYDR